jgi:predicted dehydrogenase
LLTPVVAAAPRSRAEFDHTLDRLALPASQLPAPLSPLERRPVVTFGAGSIVRDAHAPAYRRLGLPLLGVFDPNPEAAAVAVRELGYGFAASSLDEAVARGAERGALFDLALPPDAILETLSRLPEDSAVLIQKPIGKTLAEAFAIDELCRKKRLLAGVNFQLPFSPQVTVASSAVSSGLIGKLITARVELELVTTWSLWEFLLHEPRIEILLHSIHYLSLFAFALGEPESVASTQSGDPDHPVFRERDICSATRLDYRLADGTPFTVSIRCNHLSKEPRERWRSELVLEGEHGTIVAGIHDNLDYPSGVDDTLEIRHRDYGAREVPLVGNRFPMAFVATMAHLARAFANGSVPPNDLSLGLLSMRLAESCYRSNARGGEAVELASEPAHEMPPEVEREIQ